MTSACPPACRTSAAGIGEDEDRRAERNPGLDAHLIDYIVTRAAQREKHEAGNNHAITRRASDATHRIRGDMHAPYVAA